MRCSNTLMPKPHSNNTEIYPRLQQMHGGRVPKMGSSPFSSLGSHGPAPTRSGPDCNSSLAWSRINRDDSSLFARRHADQGASFSSCHHVRPQASSLFTTRPFACLPRESLIMPTDQKVRIRDPTQSGPL